MRAMKSDGGRCARTARGTCAWGRRSRARASPRSPRRSPAARPRPAPARHHLLDLGVAADLASCLARRVGHRRGEYAHAAAHEPPLTHAALGLLARVVVQQHVAGAGRRRPGHAVVDGVPAEGRLDVVTLEPLRQELVRARREQVRQVGEALAAAGRCVPTSPARPGPRASARADRAPSSRTTKDGLHELGEVLLEAGQGTRIGGREPSRRRWRPCRRRGVAGAVGVQVQRRTAGSTTIPRCRRRMSCQIDSRSIDRT